MTRCNRLQSSLVVVMLTLSAIPASAQCLRKQSDSTYNLYFLMIDSSDHVTGKTGLTPTVTISKAGASFASPSGTVSEIANGWYEVAGNTTDSNTLGSLLIHATSTGADPTDKECMIVNYDPFTFPTNFGTLSIDSNGRVKAQVNYIKDVAIANYTFFLTDATFHNPLTGKVNADFTKEIRKDSGSVAALSGTITEVDSTNFPGLYQVDLSASDLNATVVSLRLLTSDSDPTVITIVTSQ